MAVADPQLWQQWWPTLNLTVTRARGLKGWQWQADARAGIKPALAGSVELWLEPLAGGVLLHHYVRLDPVDGRILPRRRRARLERKFGWQGKRVFWRLKDDLERRATPVGGLER